MNKTVFVSFDYDMDSHYKRLLNAWNANSSFSFGFTDHSITVPINSTNASVIKAGITKKLSQARYCLVIIGKDTHRSEWVSWEINKAKELGLQLLGVKTHYNNTTPTPLLRSNTAWANSFTLDGIITALNKA
ncbi:TIR domain-containing protein [Bacillus infantis]|nr:TIR domain-containing protein [Bacillus infantis]